MRRLIDPETGEIIDAIVITDLARFRQAQQRLTFQGRPMRQTKRSYSRKAPSASQWWLTLANHLGPMVVLGSIAASLLLHR